jgi:hypothetical protein
VLFPSHQATINSDASCAVATSRARASALSLDLAGKIVTVLDCGIEDLLEVVEGIN